MGSVSKNVTGFTLVELVVALAVAAILMALAIPSFNAFFERARLRGAIDDAVSMITTAKGDALKTSRDVTVSVGGSTAQWCIGANEASTPAAAAAYVSSAACDCTISGKCMVGGVRRVVDAVAYQGVSLGAVGTTFQIDGKLGTLVDIATTPKVLMVSPTGDYQLQLEVSPLGQARACVPSGQRPFPGFTSC